MSRPLWVSALLFLAGVSMAGEASDAPPPLPPGPLATCGDAAEWPPFTFYRREEGRRLADVTGYDVAVLRYLFDPQRHPVQVSLPPWNRCLYQAGRGRQWQIVVSASLNEERLERFLASEIPYYVTTPYYFYAQERYPDGMGADVLQAAGDIHRCGLSGYNYTAYGLDNRSVDRSSKDYGAVIERLHRGSCDVMLAEPEIIGGFLALNGVLGPLDLEGIEAAPFPGGEPIAFHFLVPRVLPQARALKAHIDARLIEARDRGVLQRLYEHWQPDWRWKKQAPTQPMGDYATRPTAPRIP